MLESGSCWDRPVLYNIRSGGVSHANLPYFVLVAEGLRGAFLAGHLSGLKRCATALCRNPPTGLIRYVTVFYKGLVTTILNRPTCHHPGLFHSSSTRGSRGHLPGRYTYLLTCLQSSLDSPCRLFNNNYKLFCPVYRTLATCTDLATKSENLNSNYRHCSNSLPCYKSQTKLNCCPKHMSFSNYTL